LFRRQHMDFDVDLESAIRRYRADRFTDADIMRCAFPSRRGWRELIKRKAVRTEETGRGRGRIRICDATTFKRVAVISALNQAGLSLAVAGQVAFFLPWHTLLYAACDPVTILSDTRAQIDANTGLPPRLAQPHVDWFDADKPAEAEADDWLIEIVAGRFVGVRYDASKAAARIFGDLREDATRFVAWTPLPGRRQSVGGAIERIAEQVHGDSLVKFIAVWENPSKWPKTLIKELSHFGYAFEHHEGNADPLCVAAAAAARSSVVRSTINISLALRKALRRYLELETPLQSLDSDKDEACKG